MESSSGHSNINTPQDTIATLPLLLLNILSILQLIKCQSMQVYFEHHAIEH